MNVIHVTPTAYVYICKIYFNWILLFFPPQLGLVCIHKLNRYHQVNQIEPVKPETVTLSVIIHMLLILENVMTFTDY